MPRPRMKQSEQEEPTTEPLSEVVVRPKRKCSEKQLAALAAGRAKNSRFKPKQVIEENDK